MPHDPSDVVAIVESPLAEAPGAHPWMRGVCAVLGVLVTVTCLQWALDLPQYIGIAVFTEQVLALVLGLALALAFHAVSAKGKPQVSLSWLDMALGWLALGACLWVMVHYPRLIIEMGQTTPEVLALAGIIIVLSLEALRRCTGWSLVGVVIGFIAYGLIAHLLPGEIRGRSSTFAALISYLAFDPSAILGTAMAVGVTVVIMFLWMGETLMRAGGGDFFRDIAMAFLGHRRGGPAKICIVGSALFGTISGSAVSNVASVGVLTIPMMIRTGYSRRDAGAIEAVGSTGGQLMPPVMGAAAFLMAEFLQVPYVEVALAAAIPAVLYYWGLYCQVDLIAGKRRIGRLTEALPEVWAVLREGWHFLIPFAILIVTLFYWESSPQVSAIGATLAMFAVGSVRSYRGQRLRPRDVLTTLSATGRSSADLFMTLAGAGLVIGVLNVTGLGFALTLMLVNLAGGSLLPLLFVAAIISLILGMGMPTTAVYILLAVLAAPSLVQAGVMMMAAHMFILYFGMLSMITPPVALAAYAAANISGAGVMETGWAACRIGWTKFIIPFMFVASPTLLGYGEWTNVAYDAVSAFIGIYFVTVAMVGFFRRDVGPAKRLALAVAGFAAIFPDSQHVIVAPGAASAAGLAVGGLILALEMVATRRVRTA